MSVKVSNVLPPRTVYIKGEKLDEVSDRPLFDTVMKTVF